MGPLGSVEVVEGEITPHSETLTITIIDKQKEWTRKLKEAKLERQITLPLTQRHHHTSIMVDYGVDSLDESVIRSDMSYHCTQQLFEEERCYQDQFQ